MKVHNESGSSGDFSTAGGGMGTLELSQKSGEKVRKIRILFIPLSLCHFTSLVFYLVLSYEFSPGHLGDLGVEMKVET